MRIMRGRDDIQLVGWLISPYLRHPPNLLASHLLGQNR